MQHPSISMPVGLCLVYSGLVAAGSTVDISKANNAFAIDLYKIIGNYNSGKNLFFSPISISTAFGMVNLGARGKTQEQVKAVLHLDKVSSDDALNEDYKQLLASFKNQANNYTLHLVNRLFGSNVFDFHQQFLQETQKYFEASLERLDFVSKSEESRRHVNNWVEDQTQQKIKDLLPDGSIDNRTILVIVNAIYFKAFWEIPFDGEDTKPGPFRISKSSQDEMDMMHLYGEYLNYHSSSELNCEVLELPYHGGKASMFVFLPRDVEGLPNLEKQLTEEKLTETLSKVRQHEMVVQLPKFLIEQDISLKQFLQLMGMEDLFNCTVSDLSGIGGPDRLTVTDAMHKAFVNVNEAGTEAAAATGIIYAYPTSLRPPPIRFIVDRPFLFLIYEKNTKSVLFMGRLVRQPTSKESIGKFGEMAPLRDCAASMASILSGLCSALVFLFVCWRLQ